jgi:hypothetical protein
MVERLQLKRRFAVIDVILDLGRGSTSARRKVRQHLLKAVLPPICTTCPFLLAALETGLSDCRCISILGLATWRKMVRTDPHVEA